MEETRTAKFLNSNDEWEDVLPQDVKKGMKLRMFEPDGEEVFYGKEKQYFVVLSDSYVYEVSEEDGTVWMFEIETNE